MVTSMIKSRAFRGSVEMAVLGMLVRKALQEYVDRREAGQWGERKGPEASWSPRVTVEDHPDSYVILAELAGVQAEDINLSVAGDNLTLEGKRQSASGSESKQTDTREIYYGNFSRTLLLPQDAVKDYNNIHASFDNGILEITIPRVRSEIPVAKVPVKVK